MPMTLFSSTTLNANAALIEFTNIPQNGKDLILFISARTVGTYSSGFIRFNNNTTNYSIKAIWGDGASVSTGTNPNGRTDEGFIGFLSWNSASGAFGNVQIHIPNYNISRAHNWSADAVTENDAATSFQTMVSGLHTVSAPITSLSFKVDQGNILTNTIASLYILS